MRNPEGGSAPHTPQFLYKVFLHVQLFFFLLRRGGGGQRKGGDVALNLTIWRMLLHSNRQQPST